MKPKNPTKNNNWETPKDFYGALDEEFNFSPFDPCPINANFDGLSVSWGEGVSVFINPPYSRKLKEAFIRKAHEESLNGNVCVMLLPVSTSTRIFHDVIYPNAEIRFVKGRIRFSGSKGSGTFDSMVVVFKGTV